MKKILLFLIAAAIAVAGAVALFAACEREVIYLENKKPAREVENRFIGTWVRCGEAPYTDGVCHPDPSTVTFNDTLRFTEDSLVISPASIPERYEKNLYEYNTKCVVTYIKSYDKPNIAPLLEYYGGDFFAPINMTTFMYSFISDTLLNIHLGRHSIYGIHESRAKCLCYKKIE